LTLVFPTFEPNLYEMKYLELTNLDTYQKEVVKTDSKDLSAVFLGNESHYLNFWVLYTSLFQKIPNNIRLDNIDGEKACQWLEENFASEIIEKIVSGKKQKPNEKVNVFETYYILSDELMLAFEMKQDIVRLLFKSSDEEKINKLITQISKFKKKKSYRDPELSLLINTNYGLDTKSLKIAKPKLKIEDNYNDDFVEIHKTIHKRLSKNNDKGLVLLHGKPGTGKTSYIRYLIGSLKKKVIFLPPNLASAITNPELLSVLIDEPNSVFVIEDAENIIIDRETEGSSPVSALLNLSDGLLSDCLNIQIICSFNTDLSKVDSALLRKGRLIAQYEFKELETEKAQALSDKLGFQTKINEPMTLTDIYNQEERNFEKNKNRIAIGFGSN
jgi:DNA polymerase III delta prime subunit